jgi:hypothetical protein
VALVVVTRPHVDCEYSASLERHECIGSDIHDRPWTEGGNYVRLTRDDGEVLVDLRYNEHAVVAVPAGDHTFFGWNWAGPSRRYAPLSQNVGVLRARLEAGRIYAFRVVGHPRSSAPRRPSSQLELEGISGDDIRFLPESLATSDRVQPLGSRRQVSSLVDGRETLWRDWGLWRLQHDGTWSSASSTLRPEDGVRALGSN